MFSTTAHTVHFMDIEYNMVISIASYIVPLYVLLFIIYIYIIIYTFMMLKFSVIYFNFALLLIYDTS